MAKKEADPAVKACLESAIRTMHDGIDKCHIQLSRRLSHGDELNLINEVINTLAWAQARVHKANACTGPIGGPNRRGRK